MVNLILAQNISKSFSDKPLFSQLSFSIHSGEKIALFGRNGQGKSTLLRIIAQKETSDSGTIDFNSELAVIFVEQNHAFQSEETLIENVLSIQHPLVQTLKHYRHALAHHDNERLPSLLLQMDEGQIWDLETELKIILDKLGLISFTEKKISLLSGGQVKRLALAKSLLEIWISSFPYKLLLLDEPTNHLDLEMISWLEDYLSKADISLIMVTHDRRFLDAVCNEIWNLENNILRSYKGDYEYFITQKFLEEESEMAAIEKAKNLYTKELDWMRRQPKARTTKSKSRIDNFYIIEEQAKRKMEKDYVRLEMNTSRLGSKIVDFKQVCKHFGDKQILHNFTYSFKHGDKIGVVGKNGIGKTTLLNILQQLETVDSGTVKIGETVKFGYYQQKGIVHKKDERVIDYVKGIAEYFSLTKGKTISASQFLEMFLFTREKQYAFTHLLSGGEQRKLQLLATLFAHPNFLILDEPTNDLDIDSLMVLEKFLIDYEGCILMVSHDRYFMDKIVQHLFVMEENEPVKIFPGNYNEYLLQKTEKKKIEKLIIEPQLTSPQPKKTSSKLSYKEKLEFQQIESEMPMLETEKKSILAQLENQLLPLSHEDIMTLSNKLEQVVHQLERNEMRWLELTQKQEA